MAILPAAPWKKNDVIISFFSYEPCLKRIVSLKQEGVISAKLFTVVHHSGVPRFLLSQFDRCIFRSKEILEKSYSYMEKEKVRCLWWGADLSFYEKTFSEMNKTKGQRYHNIIVVSTGKTTRDHQLLSDACEDIKLQCLLFDKNIKETKFTKTTVQAGYLDMISRMSKCSINVVPVINHNHGETQSIRGFTSIIDGMVLGMPLIVSDNCNLPFDVQELRIGLYYKNGNLEDLKAKLQYMATHPLIMEEMSRNARNYAVENDYVKYCNDLYKKISTQL